MCPPHGLRARNSAEIEGGIVSVEKDISAGWETRISSIVVVSLSCLMAREVDHDHDLAALVGNLELSCGSWEFCLMYSMRC